MSDNPIYWIVIIVVALVILGVTAGALDSARPTQEQSAGSTASLDSSSSSGAASPTGSQSGGQSTRHLLLPEWDVTDGFARNDGQSESILIRLAVGISLLIAGGAVVLWQFTSGETDTEITTESPDVESIRESGTSTPVSNAQHVPAKNDIHRAWLAMTVALDIPNKQQRTPSELAYSAINAGFPEPAVQSLTELFCLVRYSSEPATKEREQRARDALRTIRQAGYLTEAADAKLHSDR